MAYTKNVKTKEVKEKFDVKQFELDKMFQWFQKSAEEKKAQIEDQIKNGSMPSNKCWNALKFIENPHNFVSGKKFKGNNALNIAETVKNTSVIGSGFTTLNEIAKIYEEYKDHIPEKFWNNDKRHLTGKFLQSHIKNKLEEPAAIFYSSPVQFVKSVKKSDYNNLSDDEKLLVKTKTFNKNGKEIEYYEIEYTSTEFNEIIKKDFNDDLKLAAKNGYKIKPKVNRYFLEYNIDNLLEYLPDDFFKKHPKLKDVLDFKDLDVPREVIDTQTSRVSNLLINAFKEELGVDFVQKNVDRACCISKINQLTGEVSVRIETCPENKFSSDLAFLSTIVHEIAHSTKYFLNNGNKLNNNNKRFYIDDGDYAQEELVAELTVSMLNTHFGIDTFNDAAHLQYIENWLKEAEKDPEKFKKVLGNAMNDAEIALNKIEKTVNSYCLKYGIDYDKEYGYEARLKIVEEIKANRELNLKEDLKQEKQKSKSSMKI